jgi:hypothetical protein
VRTFAEAEPALRGMAASSLSAPLLGGAPPADEEAGAAKDAAAASAAVAAAAASADDPLIFGATASEDRAARNQRSWESDANWRGVPCCGGTSTPGFCYYGYADDRLCVQRRCVRCWRVCRCYESKTRRWVFGLTGLIGAVNLGHRCGWPVLIAVILLFVGGEGVSWAVSFFNAKL